MRRLKNWLASYMTYTEHSEAPDQFHHWSGVAAIAGALRRKVWLDMGYFKWFPNHYIFFIAPPGIVSKGTTVSIATDLLEQIPGIFIGPSACTWQALVKIMAESVVQVNDESVMSAVTVAASEAGTFFDPTNREQVDFLTDMWDCKFGREGVWGKSTKGSGSESIANPCLNLVCCTTPAWVAENFSGYFIGGGFAARTIFVYAERKRQFVAYPKQHIPVDHNIAREDLIHDLEEIGNLQGEFAMTPEAFEWGETWYKRHWDNVPKYSSNDQFKVYLARKQAHLHKLAMVLTTSMSDELVITPFILNKANEEITSLEENIISVFGQMNKEPLAGLPSQLMDRIMQEGGKMEKNDLYRHFFKVMTYDSYESAIKTLVSSELANLRSFEGKLFIYIDEKVRSKL